jgi:LAS superfamily LD-carboxypeptidase LdcB
MDFGFVLSYGEDNKIETGYMKESWHLRYIGHARIPAWKKRHLLVEADRP